MTEKTKEKVDFDKGFLKAGEKYIVGVDEVGRGPLAGPVVCCAVIMPLDDGKIIEGINDSKKLSEKKRIVLDEAIRNTAVDYCICEVSPEEIDEINILQATKLCMKKCIDGLKVKPHVALIDAVDIHTDCRKESVIKGDFKSYTIGAASIVAKVYRDNLMYKYDKIYPEYKFASNKGYGTKDHINALKEVGACPIHRETFIKNFSVKKEKI
ncbi:MAG: ribonuclease HII [Clostridia bacterium]|nr:ribonuclease HII [Clostridia bacterium]